MLTWLSKGEVIDGLSPRGRRDDSPGFENLVDGRAGDRPHHLWYQFKWKQFIRIDFSSPFESIGVRECI